MEYEALVKISDSVNTSLPIESQASDLYKAGDIVVVRPKGWTWGRREVKEFLIVDLGELTEEEAMDLEKPVTVEYIEPEDPENPLPEQEGVGHASHTLERKQSKIVARRRSNFDIKQALTQYAPHALIPENMKRLLDRNDEFQPLKSERIGKQYISDKLASTQMLDRVAKTKTDLELENPGRKIL